jgi:hypothetical protein
MFQSDHGDGEVVYIQARDPNNPGIPEDAKPQVETAYLVNP